MTALQALPRWKKPIAWAIISLALPFVAVWRAWHVAKWRVWAGRIYLKQRKDVTHHGRR